MPNTLATNPLIDTIIKNSTGTSFSKEVPFYNWKIFFGTKSTKDVGFRFQTDKGDYDPFRHDCWVYRTVKEVVKMAEQIRIQVLFSEDTPYGIFQDALYYTEAEWETVKKSEVEKEKQRRLDNWKTIITTPSVELSKEEQMIAVQEQIDMANAHLKELEAQKLELGDE